MTDLPLKTVWVIESADPGTCEHNIEGVYGLREVAEAEARRMNEEDPSGPDHWVHEWPVILAARPELDR